MLLLILKDYLALPEEKREASVECFNSQGHFIASMNQSSDAENEIAMELQPFQYLGLSLFKTLMMMLGEYEHTATVVEPLIGQSPVSVHFPAITLFFYVAFVFLVPIILMNLLVSHLMLHDSQHHFSVLRYPETSSSIPLIKYLAPMN